MLRLGLMCHSPYIGGGAQEMLVNLAVLLKKTGKIYPILFIPLMQRGGIANKAKRSGIECIEMPNNPWYIYKKKNQPDEIVRYNKSVCGAVERLETILLNHHIDMVINNTLTNITPVLAAVRLQIPVITWVKGVFDSYLLDGFDGEYRLLLDRSILQLSQKVIFNALRTEKFYTNFISKEKTCVIYNWTNEPVEQKDYDTSINHFVCLNRLEARKGIMTLIDAARILKSKNYLFVLEIYGDGPELEKQKITDKIKGLGLKDCIILKGITDNVSHVYHHCTALIQPSYLESFGMTIIEAMAHSRPVIAARAGGPEEIIQDGYNGFFAEPGNIYELAGKMGYILDHKERAKLMGMNGRKSYLERFSEEVAEEQFIKVIKEVMEGFTKYSHEQMLVYDLLRYIHH